MPDKPSTDLPPDRALLVAQFQDVTARLHRAHVKLAETRANRLTGGKVLSADRIFWIKCMCACLVRRVQELQAELTRMKAARKKAHDERPGAPAVTRASECRPPLVSAEARPAETVRVLSGGIVARRRATP